MNMSDEIGESAFRCGCIPKLVILYEITDYAVQRIACASRSLYTHSNKFLRAPVDVNPTRVITPLGSV